MVESKMATRDQPTRKVVVTGMAVSSPAGFELRPNIDAWYSGQSFFSEILSMNTKDLAIRWGGSCLQPPVNRLPDKKVQKILRRKDVIGVITTLAAAENAGLRKGEFNPDRCGMYVGAVCTQIGDLQSYYALVQECADLETGLFNSHRFGSEMLGSVNPLVVLQTLMNNTLCFGTMFLDIRGVNTNYMDFQTAGIRAVGEAWHAVSSGRADIVLAGGVSGPVEPFQLLDGVQTGFLANTSSYVEPPTTVVKPWDKRRMGAILGEGSAFLVLEEESHAKARGATALAQVLGFAQASDGTVDLQWKAASPGLVKSMEQSIRVSGISVDDLGLVVGHGCGALANDACEAASYVNFLGTRREVVPLTSVKGTVGDLSEAGSALNVIVAIEALRRREAPPTTGFSEVDPVAAGLQISNETTPIHRGKDAALITSRNFLGGCAALVVAAP
jgi:3-oxoacyl-[acyl-carrier-protein] synthase II